MLVKASEEHEQIRNDQKLAQREIQKRADEIDQLEKVSFFSHPKCINHMITQVCNLCNHH